MSENEKYVRNIISVINNKRIGNDSPAWNTPGALLIDGAYDGHRIDLVLAEGGLKTDVLETGYVSWATLRIAVVAFSYGLKLASGEAMTSDRSIDSAMEKFIGEINKSTEEHSKGFSNMSYGDGAGDYFNPFTYSKGQKRIKVWQNCYGRKSSIYCFVDIKTGDILKAASVNQPAKGARGNVFRPETYQGQELHSTGWMYKR